MQQLFYYHVFYCTVIAFSKVLKDTTPIAAETQGLVSVPPLNHRSPRNAVYSKFCNVKNNKYRDYSRIKFGTKQWYWVALTSLSQISSKH